MKEVHYHIQPGDEPEKPPAEEEAREALTSLRGPGRRTVKMKENHHEDFYHRKRKQSRHLKLP